MSATESESGNHPGGLIPRRFVIYAVVLIAAFLIGFVPMWILAYGRGVERDAARRDLRLCQLQASLSSAAVESRRGDYEPARLAASNFFTSLSRQVDPASEPSDLSSAQIQSLRPLLIQRDDLITLLARSDPASADRLAEMYVLFKRAMGSAQP